MEKRKKRIIILLTILVLASIGVTYSLMVWRTPTESNTNITFTSNGLDDYVIYHEGESITAEDAAILGQSVNYLGGANTTIDLYKTTSASSLSLYGHIYLDVNSISNSLTDSSALKWSILTDGHILDEGSFYGVSSGDTIKLGSNIILRDTFQSFTVFIWLDHNAVGSDSYIGDSISTVIRCSVTDEPDHSFTINSITNPSPSVILTDASSNTYYISEYAIERDTNAATQTSSISTKKPKAKFMSETYGTITIPEPTNWVTLNPSVRHFVHEFYYTQPGTYYIWVKTVNGDVRFQTIEVTNVDTTAPDVMLARSMDIASASANMEITIPLKVVDTGSGITSTNFNINSVLIKVGDQYVTPTTKRMVFTSSESGNYYYNLIIGGINTDGALSVEIPANAFTDNVNNSLTSAKTISTGVIIKTEGPKDSSVVINSGAEYTNNDHVNLTLASTGAETICVSNTITCTNYIPYRTSYSWVLESSNGEKMVYVNYKDDAGNISRVTDTIILDNTPPRFATNGSASSNYINSNQTVSIPLKITDSGSGIDPSDFAASDVLVKVNGTTVNPSKSLTYISETKGVYTYALTLSSIQGSGALTLEIQGYTVTDGAGNANALTELVTGVTLDNTNPTVTSVSATSTGRTITVNMAGADSSGIGSYWYSINGTTYYSSSNSNYTFSGVNNGTYTVSVYVKDSAGNSSSVSTTTVIVAAANLDTSLANEPVLADGMIPVYYDSSSSAWKKADVHNSDVNYQWYTYTNQKWANAVLVSSSKRSTYMNAADGTTITDSDILGYFVWIPRYKYKVWNISKATGTDSYSARTTGIDIVFESNVDSTGTITCTIGSSNKTESCTGSNGQYYTHPAFLFDGENLKGFWVSKFDITGTSSNPTSLPNQSLPSGFPTTISAQFTMSQNFASSNYMTTNGANDASSHMIKSIEWGAVAYLANSRYGLCPNGTCTEIGVNNYSSYRTGCGAAAGTSYSSTCNAYNSTNGQKASTTGNVFGIYDMSGGMTDYVMGTTYATGNTAIAYANSSFTSTTLPANSKYTDIYAYGTSGTDYSRGILGDATSEVVSTSGTSWYSDTATFPNITETWVFITTLYTYNNWMIRGGSGATAGSTCGLFNYSGNTGTLSSSSFHTVIKP